MIGRKLGRYEIVERLGHGGMGVVYVAVHEKLRIRAVVKVLHAHMSANEEVVRRFENEALAAAQIGHVGIVKVMDVGRLDDGSPFILMEFLEGETLGERLKKTSKLPELVVVSLTKQIARALGAAHAKGIVHRDLKPDNIFLVPDPEVLGGERIKLLDFGIAKLMEGENSGFTQSGMLMGTPPYMSPEQCEGAGKVDHRTDLYAVGVIMFEMLCGRRPFIESSPGKYITAHIGKEPPAVHSFAPQASDRLASIVGHLLVKEPEQRIASARLLVTELDSAANNGAPRQLANSKTSTNVSGSVPPPPGITIKESSTTRSAELASTVEVTSVISAEAKLKTNDAMLTAAATPRAISNADEGASTENTPSTTLAPTLRSNSDTVEIGGNNTGESSASKEVAQPFSLNAANGLVSTTLRRAASEVRQDVNVAPRKHRSNKRWLLAVSLVSVAALSALVTIKVLEDRQQQGQDSSTNQTSASVTPDSNALDADLPATGPNHLDARSLAGSPPQSCKDGNVNACIASAVSLSVDLGDSKRTADMYERACELGAALGCLEAARILRGDGKAKDEARALSLYVAACTKNGSGNGCLQAALMYQSGRGTKVSSTEASRYFVQAAAALDPPCQQGSDGFACEELAYLYENGLGVAKAPKQATALYSLASKHYRAACHSKNNDGKACSRLAEMYDIGYGVHERSQDEAKLLHQRACNLNHKPSCDKIH